MNFSDDNHIWIVTILYKFTRLYVEKMDSMDIKIP